MKRDSAKAVISGRAPTRKVAGGGRPGVLVRLLEYAYGFVEPEAGAAWLDVANFRL
jgi:hypothetical protein